MSARVSVVVPVYNVAAYLGPCLESLAGQTMGDLEVVMVDDGSTDESVEIAKRFVARDARFRLVRQANAGLGAARNTGIEHATGEFIAFADSDDLLPPDAYEALLGALDASGSDFASGNVRRLSSSGVVQAGFLAKTFERTRLGTHITKFPRLISDRPAWNKLFRRSFWDEHRFRFPVGVLYEDSALTLRAHYLAKSVDVLDTTVYLWRVREGENLSITQRRTDTKALRDRVAAVDAVSRFLADHRFGMSKALYDRSVIGSDLRYFLDVLPGAGQEYRRLFFDLANDFLDRADAWALEQPMAIDRLKWQLVRRRAVPEVLEVLRFADEEMAAVPPVRGTRHWYGDYPYRGDGRLGIPRSVYRLQDELAPVFKINDVRWEGETLRIEGYAYIDLIGAPEPDSQQLEILMRPAGWSPRRIRMQVERIHRPDVTANAAQQIASLDWSGFVATLDAKELKAHDAWKVGVVLRAGGLVRRTWSAEAGPLQSIQPARLERADGVGVEAAISAERELTVRIQRNRSTVRSCSLDEGILELEGDIGAMVDTALALRVSRLGSRTALEFPVHVDRSGERATFLTRVPLHALVGDGESAEAAGTEEPDDGATWSVELAGESFSRQLTLGGSVPDTSWRVNGLDLGVRRVAGDRLTLVQRSLPPVVTEVEWLPGGALLLAGTFAGPAGEYDVVLRVRGRADTYSVPFAYDADARRFTAELAPAAVGSLAGTRPLAAGMWTIAVLRRGSGHEEGLSPAFAPELLARLPVCATIGCKRFRVGLHVDEFPVLAVDRDLEEDERGGFTQRRLRTSYYATEREGELREAVLFDCFDGREYSDSPRALHEELMRRGLPLEFLWVVRDGACRVPETAVAVRAQSVEYYEAYARARYLVANDHWPRWFVRRSEQTCLQTWHGAPVKRHGRDLADLPPAFRAYRDILSQHGENWQYVLAPGAFATPILRRAFPMDGEVLETGLPRTDLLAGPDRDRRAREVRRRLGLDGQRVILYAPTYRDNLGYNPGVRLVQLRDVSAFRTDIVNRGGYRLGSLPDLATVRAALGEDDVLLFRKHRDIVDGLPAQAEEAVLDVSDYPDATELLLAADVLVTDYSSAVFDFATTGRPILFFTPDLESYRDEVRGFSLDFEADAPGPLLRTTDDLIEALAELDSVAAEYKQRYERFVGSYCSLNDGHAAARAVDAVFGP
jgi:CDP-glycerol glycerophosphotransferase